MLLRNCFGGNLVNISFGGNEYYWKREKYIFGGKGEGPLLVQMCTALRIVIIKTMFKYN